MRKVESVEHLRKIITEESKHDFFISLGIARSSKFIDLSDDGKTFFICNEIDGSDDQLTEEELMNPDYTNVGLALTKGALYCYD